MNGVTILFVYAVIMILATVILTKKEKNVERFCVGSRSENWLMSALNYYALMAICDVARKKYGTPVWSEQNEKY